MRVEEEGARRQAAEERERLEAEAHRRAEEERQRLEEEIRCRAEEEERRLAELEVVRKEGEEAASERTEQEQRIRADIETLKEAEEKQLRRLEAETHRRVRQQGRTHGVGIVQVIALAAPRIDDAGIIQPVEEIAAGQPVLPGELVIDALDVLVVGLRRWLHVIKQSAGLIGQRDGLQDLLRHWIQLRRRDEVARNRLLRDRVFFEFEHQRDVAPASTLCQV